MSKLNLWGEIEKIVSSYIQLVKAELHERWHKWPLDLSKREVHDGQLHQPRMDLW
jgi:hypothetical protein